MRVEFMPECNADTALLLELGIHLKHINKADNNSKIAKGMFAQLRYHDKVIIGLTDHDKKNIPRYFDEFEVVESGHSVIYKRKPQTNQYLIFLQPAVEGWLLSAGLESDLSITNFGFPDDVKRLKKITTHESIKFDSQFRSFIREISLKNAAPINFLKRIISTHYPY